MDSKPNKGVSPKAGKKLPLKGKDSMGAKLGGRPGSKRPFKAYDNVQKKGRFGNQGNAAQEGGAKRNRGRRGGAKRSFSEVKEEVKEGPVSKKWKPTHIKQEHGDGDDVKNFVRPHGEDGAQKVDWSDFKEHKKKLKNIRKQTDKKGIHEIICKSKEVWETLRRKDCPEVKKATLMEDLYKLIRGKIKEMSYAHDSVRVLQSFIKFGTHEQREEICEALKEDLVKLSMAKYAKYLVLKLLTFGNKQVVSYVIQACRGHVRRMLRHAAASEVVEYAYNDKAVLAQRLLLTEELYGNTFTVCKSAACPTIQKVLEQHPDKLDSIIEEMKNIITPMAQKEQVIKHSLVHKVFLDFFLYASEKPRAEMIESIREAVVYMAYTHDGARVTMHCLWHGRPKDRKVIIKTMKSYMVKFATAQYGHLVLLAIFDCVDDTKLVKQTVLAEILGSLQEVINDKYGRKVLSYLLSPRNRSYMLPEIITYLEQGDNNAHSKKDPVVRRTELLEVVSSPLLVYLRANATVMVMDRTSASLSADILRCALGDLTPAMTAVAAMATSEFTPGGKDGQLHMAEHPSGHLVLKWLINQDRVMVEAGRTERFSRLLLDTVGVENMVTWVLVNRGSLILCSLLEGVDQSVVSQVTAALNKILPQLRLLHNNKGAQILLKHLGQT